MNNSDIYNNMAVGSSHKVPSFIGALTACETLITAEEIKSRLEVLSNLSILELNQLSKGDISIEKRRIISYLIKLEIDENTYTIKLFNRKSTLDLKDYSFDTKISEETKNNYSELNNYLEVAMTYDKSILEEYHIHLKIVNALIPDANLIIDNNAKRVYPNSWIDMIAKTSILPSPEFLYNIRTIYEKDRYWIRTEGLNRCMALELEIINITKGVNEMIGLLHNVVSEFIYYVYPEKEPFQIGYDGLDIKMEWLRWEEGVKQYDFTAFGGTAMRYVDSQSINPYQGPAGILFAVEDDVLVSPEIYGPTLKKNPTYLVRDIEISRVTALAKERLCFFMKLWRENHHLDDWHFLMQVGIDVTDKNGRNTIEHLWYLVQNITDDGVVEGKLLSTPYWSDVVEQGEIYTLDIPKSLTSWSIYHQHQKFSPDTIYESNLDMTN